MAFADKMTLMAERLKAAPAMHTRADGIMNRLSSLEQTGGDTFSAIEAIVKDYEDGVEAGKVVLRQLTNSV
jgi:hypothetical protein